MLENLDLKKFIGGIAIASCTAILAYIDYIYK